MAKWVYLFKEGNADMRNLLGGKGANLAEMTNAGMPVPQGFTVTTEACTRYYDDGKKIAPEIEAEIMTYLAWLEETEYIRVGIPRPGLVVYLDMAPETSRQLLSRRYHGDESKKDLHEADLAYLIKCREAALYGAEKLGWTVIRCCDGKDPFPPGEVAEKVWQAVAPMLAERTAGQ